MAVVTSNLTFSTVRQSLWRPGPATDLTIDSGNTLIWDPEPIVKDFGFSALGFSLDAEFFLDVRFGLLAYASLGTGGHFDADYNISVNVTLPGAIVSGNAMTFDFRNYQVTSSSITTAGFGTPESSSVGKIGAGLDLIVEAQTGFRDIVFGHWFGEEGPSSFDILNIKERITLLEVSPLNPEFVLNLTEGVTLTARLPTGASIDESRSSNGGGKVFGEGASDRQFLSLDADIDALLVRMLEKISFPPVTVIAKFLGEVVFAEHSYDIGDYLPFVGKGKAAFNFTLLDITANAGLNVTEEVSLDINKPKENPTDADIPDILVTLVSDNGTPGDSSDDKTTRGALGQVLSLDSPVNQGVGDAIITATYSVNRASFFHGVGVGINASITIDALQGYLTGSWVPEALRFSFGPLFTTQIPEGGFQVNLGNIYEDTFEVAGSAFNTETEKYKVLFVDPALAPTGWQPNLPNAEEALYGFFAAAHANRVATQANYEMSGFDVRPDDLDGLGPNYNYSALSGPVMFVWTGAFTNGVTLNTTNGSVATVDTLLETPSTPLTSGFVGFGRVNSAVSNLTGYQLLQFSASSPNASVQYSTNLKVLTVNTSVNVAGTANADAIVLSGNDTSFIDGGSNQTTQFDTFIANFAAHYGDVAIRWDLNKSVTDEQDGNPATAGGIELFANDPAIVDLTVRNIERAIIETGAADDYLVGWIFSDVFVTGNGDDIVTMPADANADIAILGGGDDVYISAFSSFAVTANDIIYGGTGIDNAFVSAGSQGLRYDVIFNTGSAAGSIASSLLGGTSGIGATTDFASIQAFYNTLSVFNFSALVSPGNIAAPIFSVGPEFYISLRNGVANTMEFRDDVEHISIVAGGSGDDLAIFLGGTRYDGGLGIDTFAADFSRYHSLDGFGPRGGINLMAGRDGIDGYYGETVIDGFERLIVTATTANDVLIGGGLSDYLAGGDGNDILLGSARTLLEAQSDTLIGGAGNDLFYWSNGGSDILDGGTGLDRLEVSANGVEAHGLRYRFTDTANGVPLAGTDSFYWAYDSAQLLLEALDLTASTDSFAKELSFGNGVNGGYARTFGIEVVNIRGAAAQDDLMIYQGGISYIGGERANDDDTFVADLRGFSAGIIFVIQDDEALDGSDGYVLANTIYIEGIDRGVLLTGDGNDRLIGGELDDYFASGAGNDTLGGGEGNNVLLGGAGNDLFTWLAIGNDTISGGDFRDLTGRDVLLLGGAANGVSNLRAFTSGGSEINTNGPLTAFSSHTDIGQVVTEALTASRFIYTTRDFAVDYSNISKVEFAGSDSTDEIALFQYGENYWGGERVGDADLFAGDFRFSVNPNNSFGDMYFDARRSDVYEAADDLNIGGFERFHLYLGEGTHLVRGGDLGDAVFGGDGFVTFESGLGNDVFQVGTGGGLFTHTGGNDTVFGSGAGDTIVYVASGAVELQFFDVNFQQIGPILSRVTGLQDLSVFQQILDATISFTNAYHGSNSINYSGVSEIFATGSSGNDVLMGGFGQNQLVGGDGDDVLIVRQGNNVMIGGAGRDTYVFDDLFGSAVILNETDSFTDTILMFTGATFAELSFANDGLDLLITTSPEFFVSSTLRVVDYFAAGPNGSNFAIMTTDSFFTIDLSGFGAFTGLVEAAASVVIGTDGDDDFGPGNHVGREIHMGNGDDFARAGAGADLFFGGVGQDGVSYVDADSGVLVDLGLQSGSGGFAQGDIYSAVEHAAGSRFDDQMIGSAVGNTFVADAGNDSLFGIDGDDALFGGLGNDSIDGGNNDDVLQGDEGNDTIIGGHGNDVLRGGDGDDSLDGGTEDDLIETGNGNDSVQGGDGDDIISYIGNGHDTIDGGIGSDWVSFAQHTARVVINLRTGAPVLSDDGENETTIASLTGIDNLRGTDFDDELIGNDGDNIIDGGLGFNVMTGHNGADTFISTGRLGFVDYDTETGTQGLDLVFQAFTPGLSAHIAGTDSHGATDRLFNIAFIRGTRFADNIQGNDDDNELQGGDGEDVLNGLNGNDLLFGGDGNDLLLGFFGNDTLLGGDGTNTLRGEDGNDHLISDALAAFDNMIGGAGFDLAYFDGFETGVSVGGGQVFKDGVQIGQLDGIEGFVGGIGNDTIQLSAADQLDPANREFLQAYYYTGGFDEVTGTNVFLGGQNTVSFSMFDAAVHVRLASGIARTDDLDTITGQGTRRAMVMDDIFAVIGSRHGDYLEGNVMVPPGTPITLSQLVGGDGNDTLVALGGRTELLGGDGDDLLRIFLPQVDPTMDPPVFDYLLDGGEGNDSLQIDGRTSWDIDLTASYVSLFFTRIENVVGSTGDDTLTGDSGDNGFAGEGGNDVFLGGDGNDTLIYSEGFDAFFGGIGSDTLDLARLTSAVAVDLANDTQTVQTNDTATAVGGVFHTIIATPELDVEGVIGTAFNDVIQGNGLNNILVGGLGNDTVSGQDGNDLFTYTAGRDTWVGGNGLDTGNFAEFGFAINVSLATAGLNVFHRSGPTVVTGTRVNIAALTEIENIIGTAQADVIVGDGLANILWGNGGADRLTGADGNDSLFGADASDTILGGEGADSIIGGISAADLGDSIDAGTGNDTVFGGAGNDTILGGEGADTLRGEEGDDSINGGVGTDRIEGGRGNDTIHGGDGDGLDSIFGGDGDDTLTAGNGTQSLLEGGSGNDLLVGASSADTLNGGEGNDTIVAGSFDNVNGGNGFDIVSYAPSAISVTVTLSDTGGPAVVAGAAQFDIVSNVEGVFGGSSHDALTGNSEANRLHGGIGNDTLNGEDGDDVLEGGDGNDRLNGGDGRDLLKGQVGNDTLTGHAGDDLIHGDSGTDSLVGGDGADEMHGGTENDTLLGEAGDDTLNGDAGLDTLNGGAGNDALDGGEGDDVLIGGAGGDALTGGNGIDTADYSTAAAGVVVNLLNALLNTGEAAGDIYDSIEAVTGSGFADSLIGTDSANTLLGGAGNDTLFGFGGNDTIIGGAGIDSMVGGEGDDQLFGDSSADTLDGGAGNDTMLGGSSSDTYVVDSAGDRVFETTTTTSGIDAGGTDTVLSSITYSLATDVGVQFVERLTLTGTRTINATGNALANTLTGNALNNRLDGGTGADSMIGGAGNDTYIVENSGDRVFETTTTTSSIDAGGTDTVQSSISFALFGVPGLQFVERLILTGTANIDGTGNTLANQLTGNSGNNLLNGGSGNDLMIGLGGNDTYIVERVGDRVIETTTTTSGIDAGGTDTVQSKVTYSLDTEAGIRFVENLTLTGTANINATGNALANMLTGNARDNQLEGRGGDDTLTGGGGADDFIFATAFTSAGVDTITDFTRNVDDFGLDDAVFTALLPGAITALQFAANVGGIATTANTRIMHDTATGAVFYDADGSAATARVHFATVGLGVILSEADFFVF